MSKYEEELSESWREIEAALGGRFRDGRECPPLLDLYQLVQAQASAQRLTEEQMAGMEHLEVCPVCRCTYEAALVAARSDREDLEPAIAEVLSEAMWQKHGVKADLIGPGSIREELAASLDAVGAAHPTAGGDTGVESSGGLTELAHAARDDAGERAELRRRVALVVPALLNHLGWDEALAERLTDFMLRSAEQLAGRFRDAVSNWLADFARAQGIPYTIASVSEADWLAIVRRTALDVATRPAALEPAPWVLEFRHIVLARRFKSLDELLSVEVPQAPEGLDIFRRDVFARARREEDALRRDLELN